jgi:hypothetical protein
VIGDGLMDDEAEAAFESLINGAGTRNSRYRSLEGISFLPLFPTVPGPFHDEAFLPRDVFFVKNERILAIAPRGLFQHWPSSTPVRGIHGIFSCECSRPSHTCGRTIVASIK